ncbi:MAG TPA: hypothetical protein VFN88_02895 [Caulobacteraceae bacterium]|nr:hypothetical protein [Caulobacteraceae bacterium]
MKGRQALRAGVLLAAALIAGQAFGQAQMRTTGIGGVSDRAAKPGSDKNFNPTNTNDPFNRGLAAYDSGDFKLAERMFDEVLAESPNDAVVLVLSGMSMSGRGDYKSARKQFDHALRSDRQNLDAHREMGIALAKTNDAKGAQEQLAWLKSKQAACATKCEDAGKLDRAVSAVETAITPPKAG